MARTPRSVDRVSENEPRLLEGARLFNAGRFFESHEVWESLWRDVKGKERQWLQGLIQLAAAYHHLSRGNPTGARYLFGRSRARLAPWAPRHTGLDVESVLRHVDMAVAALDRGTPPRGRPRL